MTNIEKYNEVFTETFGVSVDSIKTLKYKDVDSWNSVGHLTLIANIEDAFDIALESDDVFELSSYEKGIEILKKYGILFS